jgi:hypothetical protein
MISRRMVTFGLMSVATMFRGLPAFAQVAEEESFVQLIYPPFGAIDQPEAFGYKKPTQEQREKAAKIISETPTGPTALAIARSFSDRFGSSDPNAISQWPAPAAWNPLIVEFFKSTTSPVNNDMVAWCAST